MSRSKIVGVGLAVAALACGGAVAGIAGAAAAPSSSTATQSTTTTPSNTTTTPKSPPSGSKSPPGNNPSGHPCPHMNGSSGSGESQSGSAYEGGPPPGATVQ